MSVPRSMFAKRNNHNNCLAGSARCVGEAMRLADRRARVLHMADVISIDNYRPQLSGPAICSSCRHEWSAVAPTGTRELECPGCGSMNGLWKVCFAPETFYECGCGCHLFYVVPDGCRCRQCGEYAK